MLHSAGREDHAVPSVVLRDKLLEVVRGQAVQGVGGEDEGLAEATWYEGDDTFGEFFLSGRGFAIEESCISRALTLERSEVHRLV